jgi:hypothetical protein
VGTGLTIDGTGVLSATGGGGAAARFGVSGEDATATQNRAVEFGSAYEFVLNNTSHTKLNSTSGSSYANLELYSTSAQLASSTTGTGSTFITSAPTQATLFLSSNTAQRKLFLKPTGVEFYSYTYASGNDGTIKVPLYEGNNSVYMPLSVNNIRPDSTGNITLDLSGGGGIALSLTTTGTSGVSTYDSGTGFLNIPNYTYTLPIASGSTLGGVKVGSGLSIDGTGLLSASSYILPIASASTLGGIKVGSGLSIDGTGVLSSTGLRFGVEDNTATGNRSFSVGTNFFTLNGSNTGAVLGITNTGASSTGIDSTGTSIGVKGSSSSTGVWGVGNNWGVIGEATSSGTGIGVDAVSRNDIGAGLRGTVIRSTGNNVTNVLELCRGTTGTASNYIGGAIAFSSAITGNSGYQCGRLIHRVTNVANATVSTRFELEVYNAGTPQISFVFKDSGTLYVPRTKEFADNATAKAGGLEDGDIYRTGDLLKIVHA